MTTDEAVEAIRVASFEAPKAHSHTEWAARIEAILAAHALGQTRTLDYVAAEIGAARDRLAGEVEEPYHFGRTGKQHPGAIEVCADVDCLITDR